MPATDAQRIELASSVRNRFARDQSLTVTQARAFVRSIQTTWEVETIQWSDANSLQIFSEARKLVHAGQILSSVEGGSADEAIAAFRRAAELFEWLARSSDKLAVSVPLGLFGAGSYQLGGLPAMASGLLRQVAYADAGLRLFASFLQADFDATLKQVAKFWSRYPRFTRRDAGANYFVNEEEGDEESSDMAWLATVELVRCIGLAAHSLRRGDVARFDTALAHLQRVEKFFIRYVPEDVALLAFFLRSACERYGKSSIYLPLRRLAELNPDRQSFVDIFARRQYARGRGILWQSQQQGISRLLENASFALCTPTGSGKTLVANLAIVKELLLLSEDTSNPLALYLVPSRALAGEVEAKLSSELGRDFIVTGLYGGSDWGITDAWLTSDIPTVLIATVEKADALMRYLGPMLLSRIKLLIVDEAHQVVIDDSPRERDNFADHSSRALRLEAFISRLLARKPEIVRIALTAVAGGAAHPVAQWIESNDAAKAVGSYYRSTRQAVGVLEVRPNSAPQIALDILNDRRLAVVGRERNVYINLRMPPMPQPPAATKNSLNHFNQNSILWTALHLTEGDRRILISVTQSPEDTIRWFADAFNLDGWEDVPVFESPDDAADAALFAEARAVCVDYCGEDAHEVTLLDRGIATSHGQMPQRLRRMMVALIDRSICKITVATATLTEGVNLPFDIIVLPSLKRTVYDPARNQSVDHALSTAEFRNLSGRAGRPGAAKGMEGMTLVALPITPSTTAPRMRPTQLRQVRDRRSEYDELIGRLTEEAAGGGTFNSPLSVLLASIREKAMRLPGVDSDEDFMQWLEDALPGSISDQAGTADSSADARLADSLDELDGVLLSTIEEVQAVDDGEMTAARAETFLAALWQKTFSRVASSYEAWMEEAFIKRGQAVVETVYADAAERKRLYSYGYTPYVGQRFEQVADSIIAALSAAGDYGEADASDRLAVFVNLGNIIAADGGYGFSVRETVIGGELYASWPNVLGWWMKADDATSPANDKLRAWQTFVAENFEFRLGIAIGAAVARVWSDEAEDTLETPTLENWRDVTGLPWFAFWAKELLRWGTLEPFTAFALSQGLSKSRSEADTLRDEFVEWMGDEAEAEPEALIDPQKFLEWARSRQEAVEPEQRARTLSATLSGTNGNRGSYPVIPVVKENGVTWVDASGYRLAVSDPAVDFIGADGHRSDFDLRTQRGRPPVIVKVF